MQARPALQSLYALHGSYMAPEPALSQSETFALESQMHVFAPHAADGVLGSQVMLQTLPLGTSVPAGSYQSSQTVPPVHVVLQ